MRKALTLILSLGSCLPFVLFISGCADLENDLNTTEAGESQLQPIHLLGKVENGKVHLAWYHLPLRCKEDCPVYVEPSHFEVYQVDDDGEQRLLQKLDTHAREFTVDGLLNGKSYLFQVYSILEDADFYSSNRIMIQPGEKPVEEPFYENGELGIRAASMNPIDQSLIFLNQFRPQVQGAQRINLYYFDHSTDNAKLLRENCAYPFWAYSGREFLFSDHQLDAGQQYGLYVYSTEKKTDERIAEDNDAFLFPVFGKNEMEVFYLSHKESVDTPGIWVLDRETNSKRQLIKGFQPPEYGSNPIGLSYDPHTGLLAYAIRTGKNPTHSWDIEAINVDSQHQIKVLLQSEWQEQKPSFSPFEGGKMAFLSDRSGTTQIWLLDMEDMSVKQLTDIHDDYIRMNPVETSLSWTDLGKQLAFNVYEKVFKIPL